MNDEVQMARVALVVDDSMLIRHTVCRFLEVRGFAVESATNGLDALEILQTLLPDVIITDLIMPKMDGRALISYLKNNPATQKIPIVVLAGRKTASDTEPEEKRGDFIIYKDIAIEEQMDKALKAALGESEATS
jgi:CheY-like chemotaxis protein